MGMKTRTAVYCAVAFLSLGSGIIEAQDSLNVHVGLNAKLQYTLNGMSVTPSNRKGVVIFRVDHDGIALWKMSRWKTTFKGRL